MSLIEVRNLEVHYPVRTGFWNRITSEIKAVDGISFTIEPGQTFGLVGESGSGKSTTGKVIVGLESATKGQIFFNGLDITNAKDRKKLKYNQDVQMIFQDALSSLNPEKKIFDIISEPLRNFTDISKNDLKKRVIQLLDIVGIPPESIYKYPFQFSGGQRQRIDIARAVATNPRLIIADEPVSALDLSVQAQVLNFMKKIQRDFNVAYLFISHDLGGVRHMCTNIAIMNKGRLVELGSRDDIYHNAQHIYTKRLLAAIPSTNVNQRESNLKMRKDTEKEYQKQFSQYYDDQKLPLDLIRLSKTHLAAIPKKICKEMKKYVENNFKKIANYDS